MWNNAVTGGETIAWTISLAIASGLVLAGYWHPKQYRIVVLLTGALSTVVGMNLLGYVWGLDAAMSALLPLVAAENISQVRAAFADNNWLFSRLMLVSLGIVSVGSWIAGLLDVVGITAGNRERTSRQD